MIYQETLDYLFRQLPMFQRIGAVAYKKDLSNIRALCDLLGQPQTKYPTIHIAGTNGKGSTAHFLAAILQAHGLKVGVHTSPHYKDFRERIKINGQYASQQFVIDFVQNYRKDFEATQPSFFELAVAMSFEYFAQEKVDVAIIETGLGGELDSTNIVQPILSIITNISFDHQQFLGDTLPEIASAKAGIIKPNTPVVIGERQAETTSVFEQKAAQEKAKIIYASDHYEARFKHSNLHHTTYDTYRDNQLIYSSLQLNSIGNYQQYNLQTCLQAIEILNDSFVEIEEDKLRLGLANVKAMTRFLGRWQLIHERPLVLGDSAHNEAGIRSAVQFLKQMDYAQLHIVLNFSADKDLDKILPLFPEEATYYFAKADVPRGLVADQLMVAAQSHGLDGRAYANMQAALNDAKRSADEEHDLIYVGGSIYGLAEVL
ncbi:MAG: folylpolyglutamate synthase/dihydrofolate synthase family protein [Bacteroidota bacterium]